MKKLIIILLFIPALMFGQIKFPTYIDKNDPTDDSFTHIDSLGSGGYITVYDTANILSSQRTKGMVIYQRKDNFEYVWNGTAWLNRAGINVSIANGVISAPGAGSIGNADSLGLLPASAYTTNTALNDSTTALRADLLSADIYNDFYRNDQNIFWSGGDWTLTKSSNNLDVVIPAGYIANGNGSPILTATYSGTISNLNAIVLDNTNPAAPVWTNITPTKANIKDQPGKIVFLYNYYGLAVPVNPSVSKFVSDGLDQIFLSQTDYNSNLEQSFYKTNNITLGAYAPGSARIVIDTVIGTSVTYSFAGGTFFTGSDATLFLPTFSGVTLSNVNTTALNITSFPTVTWVHNDGTSSSKTLNKIQFIVNNYGRLSSPFPSIQHSIDEAYVVYNTKVVTNRNIIVDDNGTIGVDCDYNDIPPAIAAITDATEYKQYTLLIKDGIYDNLTHADGFGLVLKDNVHLKGESKTGTILRSVQAPSLGTVTSYDLIHKVANCKISNLTLEAFQVKYCIHADQGDYDSLIVENVIMNHMGSTGATSGFDVGIGIYGSQKLVFRNCDMLGAGLFAHNSTSAAGRDNSKSHQLHIENSRLRDINIADYNEYKNNKLFIANNIIDNLIYGLNLSVYNAGAGNDLANQGILSPWQIYFSGNQVGEISYTSQTDTLIGKFHLPGYNEFMYNSSTAISKGYAVEMTEPSTQPLAGFSDTIQWKRIAPYSGKMIYGFAEEDILSGSAGLVLVNKTPAAYFNNGAGNVVYGDKLQMNALGYVELWSSGDVIGYALEAATASGLIQIRFIK